MAISMLSQQAPPHMSSTPDAYRRSSTPLIHFHPAGPLPDNRSVSLLHGREISRPSSTVSSHSSSRYSHPTQPDRRQSIQLPGLAALAQAADGERKGTPPPQTSQIPHINMSYATVAPGQPNGVGAAPPSCHNCHTITTPLWRRDDAGAVLCNACGLFLKLHGRPRPISLKTDVIKSRNRVKNAPNTSPNSTNSTNGQLPPSVPPQPNGATPPQRRTSGLGLAAAHPDVASNPNHYERFTQQQQQGPYSPTPGVHGPDGHLQPPPQHLYPPTTSQPTSRSGTPGNLNIAPQHLFDNNMLEHAPGTTPPPGSAAPLVQMRVGTPGFSHAGIDGSDPNLDVSALVRTNEGLSQRVKELEVINDLYQGRVRELEEENEKLKQRTGERESKRKADGEPESQQAGRKRSRGDGDDSINELPTANAMTAET